VKIRCVPSLTFHTPSVIIPTRGGTSLVYRVVEATQLRVLILALTAGAAEEIQAATAPEEHPYIGSVRGIAHVRLAPPEED
jgi:hypothetical protein